MTDKEMAALLHIAPPTIHTLRNRIRKKLNIRGKGVNLRSYLQSLSRDAARQCDLP